MILIPFLPLKFCARVVVVLSFCEVRVALGPEIPGQNSRVQDIPFIWHQS
jgi:hypothetical protein